MMNTLKEILNKTKLWVLYKHNKRKMQACLREVGFGEFGKSGFRVRYPTFYAFNYFEKTRDNYKPSKKIDRKDQEILSLGDGKIIFYDEWDSRGLYPKEDSFLKNQREWLEKAEKGTNYFTSKK